MSGSIVVLSGPSGAGKSSLIQAIKEEIEPFYFSISTTSRAPRGSEQHGVEYFFVTKELFEQQIQEGSFLEYAKVHDNYYGTSLQPVYAALEKGELVLFDIDVQGHESIQKILSEITTSIFITTPTLAILQERLVNRQTDRQEVIAKRMKQAKEEILRLHEYDYVLVNDNFAQTKEELLSIIKAARLKMSKEAKEAFINGWL